MHWPNGHRKYYCAQNDLIVINEFSLILFHWQRAIRNNDCAVDQHIFRIDCFQFDWQLVNETAKSGKKYNHLVRIRKKFTIYRSTRITDFRVWLLFNCGIGEEGGGLQAG